MHSDKFNSGVYFSILDCSICGSYVISDLSYVDPDS